MTNFMFRSECAREGEVLEAITAGRWPETCDDELRAHAESCATCTDLATVAAAIAEDASDAVRQAPIPSSGLVWWRMQRRTQMEATINAKRAITFVEGVTLAATAFAVLFSLGGLSLLKFDWPAIPWNLPLIAAAATILLLAPFAVYYAVTE